MTVQLYCFKIMQKPKHSDEKKREKGEKRRKRKERGKLQERALAQCSPQHIVDTDDALGLGVLGAVDDSSLGLHPGKASLLGQHAVLASGGLALGKHCVEKRTQTEN